MNSIVMLCSRSWLETLKQGGFKTEKSKLMADKLRVPVLFGRNGKMEKAFDADGVNTQTKTVIEVEAGRGVLNNQFLKDFFQACMMHDIDNLVIAVRNSYKTNLILKLSPPFLKPSLRAGGFGFH